MPTPRSECLGGSQMQQQSREGYWFSKLSNSLHREVSPVSSCSLVNEYEILTLGWPYRCSGKHLISNQSMADSLRVGVEGVGGEHRLSFPIPPPEPQAKMGLWIQILSPTGWGRSWNKDERVHLFPSSSKRFRQGQIESQGLVTMVGKILLLKKLTHELFESVLEKNKLPHKAIK